MRDFTTPDPNLTVGSTHAGFTVTDVLALPEFSGCAYVMRHETGARTLWIATDDTNKSFAIAFKTPPADDTGVFHILEHSVLCGSEKFPVKEPFVNLLKTSMQTFLNALTFADKTMYPVASTNTHDLENLMDVYLDAVFHPAIYARRRIFEQEGWHLEAMPDGSLVYNGVVYNEMKGATSDPDDVTFHALDRMLFPDTCYSFESGGDPRCIPDLTYESFLDSHSRHYSPKNAYVILYGDMDIERELAFVGERLAGATHRASEPANPLTLQAPIRAPFTRVEMATAPENAAVALAYVIGTAKDRERVLATDVLLDAIAGSNESPLKRRILDADLADDFLVTVSDGELQPRVIFMLKGAHEGVADRFRELVEQTCAELSRDGIARDLIAASLAQAEFNLREQDSGHYPTGIMVSIYVMSSWLYDDDRPIDYLRFEDEFAHMKDGLDKGYFERLLSELVCESDHCAAVELVPCDTGAAAEEARRLQELRDSMSEDDVAAIEREVCALREEQEAPDAPEDLEKLPQLTIADIGEAAAEPHTALVEAPLPCIAHELDARHIDYVYHYFDLRHLTFEDMPYVALLAELLGKLPTKSHTAAELDTLVELNLGTLDFFCETLGREGDLGFALPMLVVGTSVLAEKVEQAARIPQEVWSETLFTDEARISDILTQRRVMCEQNFVNAGHAASVARVASYFSSASKVSGAMAGVDFYLFLKELLSDWDARKAGLFERLASLMPRVFATENVTVSFTGTPEERARFWEAGGTLALSTGVVGDTRLVVPTPTPRNEGFQIPSNVSFVSCGMVGAPAEGPASSIGTWRVAQRVLTYDYLWNEVRVKGGAYGTGFRRTQTGICQFWSYRDPGIDPTLARYDQTSAWLDDWDPTPQEMDGYVVSCVATHDAPMKPRQLARRQDTLYFCGRPAGWRDQVRAQELHTTADDIRALAATLAPLGDERHVCVFGPADALAASSVPFDEVIELLG